MGMMPVKFNQRVKEIMGMSLRGLLSGEIEQLVIDGLLCRMDKIQPHR